ARVVQIHQHRVEFTRLDCRQRLGRRRRALRLISLALQQETQCIPNVTLIVSNQYAVRMTSGSFHSARRHQLARSVIEARSISAQNRTNFYQQSMPTPKSMHAAPRLLGAAPFWFEKGAGLDSTSPTPIRTQTHPYPLPTAQTQNRFRLS